VVITISMVAVRRSIRMAQDVSSDPDWIQRNSSMLSVVPSKVRNTTQLRIADRNNPPVAITQAACSPMNFQPKPQISAPIKGAKRMMVSIVT